MDDGTMDDGTMDDGRWTMDDGTMGRWDDGTMDDGRWDDVVKKYVGCQGVFRKVGGVIKRG